MTAHEPQFLEAPPEHPDSWHRHTPDEGAPQEEHGAHENPRILAAAFVILTLGFIITVLAVIGYYFTYLTTVKAQRMETTALAVPWESMRTQAKADIESRFEDAALTVVRHYAENAR